VLALLLPALLVEAWHPFTIPALHGFGLVLLIVPLRAWQCLYPATPLAAVAYRRPWTCGFILLFPLMGLVLAFTPRLRQAEPPWVSHAREVAEDLAAKRMLAPGEPLAVLGIDPLAAAALGYDLKGEHPLEPQPSPAALTDFHAMLRDHGYAHAWVGAAEARRLLRLPDPAGASLIFATSPEGLVVRGIYPLPAPLAPAEETR
jgi:hypothetical protein